jgi:hypothetical protein
MRRSITQAISTNGSRNLEVREQTQNMTGTSGAIQSMILMEIVRNPTTGAVSLAAVRGTSMKLVSNITLHCFFLLNRI